MVFVCPRNGLSIEGLQKHGYKTGYHYHKGFSTGFLGWSGNMSNSTPVSVTKDISTFKSLDDCPTVNPLFEGVTGEVSSIPNIELTRVIHPFGRCCKVSIPSAPKGTKSFLSMRIYSKNPDLIEGLRIFMTDKNSASDFEMNQLRVNGPTLECGNSQVEVNRVKVYEEIDLEEGPNSECKNYEKSTYQQVSNIL